ncbi:CLIP domain-containing serine protease 14D-like [Contarinia nasturtii]|uniref:CLIP domain-containing serine protease 14D-like n=1 Tax=Contarinia nasturtii TaxID=265458 RepID=UPI0012D39DDE|nr:CLIP domain-containing serine protease 14D-like [Contarinia nasturtii]
MAYLILQIFVLVTIASCALSQSYPYTANNNIFNGCDYFESIQLGRIYDVFSPYYPDKYPPGTNCRWSGCAPYGTNIVIKCTDMKIPTYGTCDKNSDRLEVSYQGCQELNDAVNYCTQPFVTETRSNALVMALRSYPNSTGGGFFCQIYAQVSPLPAPQSATQTRYITGPSFPQRVYPAQRQQQYPPSYQPGYTQQGVRYEQGFQPTYYAPARFPAQSRPQPAYQPSYSPAIPYQQPAVTYQESQPVYRGYQSGYQTGYQTTYQTGYPQNVYPINQQQKPIYNSPTYSPTQQVYQPMGPQDQGQCPCGQRKRPRILNGEKIDIEQMPFACGLLDLNTKIVFCHCTIISQSFIISVGHCLFNRTIDTIGVIVGTTDYARPASSRYAATYRLSGVIVHKEYDPLSMLNDIAIGKIIGTIEYNPAVAPVCLPISERLSQQNYAYSPVEVAGYGETSYTGPTSTQLQAVTLDVITNDQCNDNYPYRITASQMCLLTPHKDTCTGDDGAGLCHVDTVTGRLVLVGMPSYGVGCGTRQPRVACRISSYIPWIMDMTKEPFCVI